MIQATSSNHSDQNYSAKVSTCATADTRKRTLALFSHFSLQALIARDVQGEDTTKRIQEPVRFVQIVSHTYEVGGCLKASSRVLWAEEDSRLGIMGVHESARRFPYLEIGRGKIPPHKIGSRRRPGETNGLNITSTQTRTLKCSFRSHFLHLASARKIAESEWC